MSELEKGKVVDFTTAGNTQKNRPADVNDEEIIFFDDDKPEDEKTENVSLLDEKADIETRIDGLPVFEYAGVRETIRKIMS